MISDRANTPGIGRYGRSTDLKGPEHKWNSARRQAALPGIEDLPLDGKPEFPEVAVSGPYLGSLAMNWLGKRLLHHPDGKCFLLVRRM